MLLPTSRQENRELPCREQHTLLGTLQFLMPYKKSVNQRVIYSCDFSEITCGAPLTPVNGLTTVHSLTTFSKAYYICKAGFVAVGDTSTTCEADGSWSGRPPICVREYSLRSDIPKYSLHQDDTYPLLSLS